MAFFPDKDQDWTGIKPVFHLEPEKKDVMGYRLADADAVVGRVIYPGTPILTDEKAKTAVLCKYAHVEAVSNDKKKLTVEPYHYFAKGDKVAVSGNETLTVLTISDVQDEGKTLVFGSAVADAVANCVLVEVVSETTGSGDNAVTTVKAKNVPNRIVNAKSEIDSLHKTIAGAHAAVVVQNFVYYPEEYLNKEIAPGSIYMKGCLGVMFIYQ